jgi:hypothetical protein
VNEASEGLADCYSFMGNGDFFPSIMKPSLDLTLCTELLKSIRFVGGFLVKFMGNDAYEFSDFQWLAIPIIE